MVKYDKSFGFVTWEYNNLTSTYVLKGFTSFGKVSMYEIMCSNNTSWQYKFHAMVPFMVILHS
jgi:hypothetical protein